MMIGAYAGNHGVCHAEQNSRRNPDYQRRKPQRVYLRRADYRSKDHTNRELVEECAEFQRVRRFLGDLFLMR
jgi:hypothetical protein